MTNEEFKLKLGESAILRGHGQYDEALILVNDTLPYLEESDKVIALLQAMYIANDMGNVELTKEYAKQASEIDPDIPSVKKVLEY